MHLSPPDDASVTTATGGSSPDPDGDAPGSGSPGHVVSLPATATGAPRRRLPVLHGDSGDDRWGRGLSSVAGVAPGLGLCALAVLVALGVNARFPALSAMLVAIVLGIVVRNVVHLPARVEPGLAFAAKRLLRIGVVLLGLQLVVGDILALGTGMVLVVVCVVSGGICSTLLIGRWMGISSTQRLLIAGGFSICGAAAVAAVDGVIETEDEEEVVTAVALVVLFGTLAIPLLPLAAGSLGMDPVRTGLWAGASVHEVAQVVAIGAGIGPAALKAAVIVKLARVLLLAPVMAVISVVRRRTAPLSARGHRPPVVPLFVAGFVAMVALRSLGIVPGGVLSAAKVVQTGALSAAMFALGCGVRLSMFRHVGPRPLVLATASTAVVGTIGLVGVTLAG